VPQDVIDSKLGAYKWGDMLYAVRERDAASESTIMRAKVKSHDAIEKMGGELAGFSSCGAYLIFCLRGRNGILSDIQNRTQCTQGAITLQRDISSTEETFIDRTVDV
jgi:hypothetical protein